MAVKWSKISPQLALAPAVAVTLVAFVGAICWTIFISFTKSRRFPEYTIDPEGWYRQYVRLFGNDAWATSLKNLVVLAIGSALAIVLGFILAAMVEREKRGEGVFRTIFLYPLAISLIVTGLVWRWMFNPSLGIQNFLREPRLGKRRISTGSPRRDTAMYAIILASIWHGMGFYMALMLAGLKGINQRDLERGAARRRELLAALFRDHHPDDEVHVPDLRDPLVARRGEGVRHRRRDDQRRAGHLHLDARLFRHQRLFDAQSTSASPPPRR